LLDQTSAVPWLDLMRGKIPMGDGLPVEIMSNVD
jgi:hypothetical protein